MAPKSLVLAALLLVVAAAAGQVTRGAGLGASVNTSVVITGVVPCSTGSSINVATAPVFPYAGLHLICYPDKVVASTTADSTGAFGFNLSNVPTALLTAVFGNQCRVVVTTPLATCDASLRSATGNLTAPLKLLGVDIGTGGSSGGLNIGGIIGGIIGLIPQIIGGLVGGLISMGTQAFSFI